VKGASPLQETRPSFLLVSVTLQAHRLPSYPFTTSEAQGRHRCKNPVSHVRVHSSLVRFKRAIVADTDEATGAAVARALSAYFTTTLLKDGSEVLEHLRATTPDLLVLAADLPLASGIDIANRVRRIKRLQQVPVLLLATPTPHWGDVPPCELGSHDGVLYRPFTTLELLRSVGTLMYQRSMSPGGARSLREP
jgi:CheY-like chemotaxis protein